MLSKFSQSFRFLLSLSHTNIHYTPFQSAKTHLKAAQRQLYNRLTTLQLEQCPLVSFDFGNIQTKIVLFVPQNISFEIKKPFYKFIQPHLGYQSAAIQGKFIFLQFLTSQFDEILEFILDHEFPLTTSKLLICTGELSDFIGQKLILRTNFTSLQSFSISDCLRKGLKFHCSLKLSEQFYHSVLPDQALAKSSQKQWKTSKNTDFRVKLTQEITFPAICVDIGLKFTVYKLSLDGYEILAEYPIGGGSYLGISKILGFSYGNSVDSGTANNVDLTVGDIYGGGYSGLGKNLLAACFGKSVHVETDSENSDSTEKVCDKENSVDYQAALLRMISINIGHITAKHSQIEGAASTIFVGGFLEQVNAMKNVSWAFNLYSGGNAIFVQHGTVLGCLGGLFGNQNEYVIDDRDEVVKIVENISKQEEMKVQVMELESESE